MKAAEVAMAPITKAFPTFSGALIVADVLGSFGEFSVLTYFFHFGISHHLMEGHGQAGFHLNQLWGVGVGGGGGESVQLNNLQSVSTILMFTSLQKMNDSVVQLKVQ